MRNNIFCLSRSNFRTLVSDLSEQQFMASAFICVNEPVHNETEKEYNIPILVPAQNILNLWFDDAEELHEEVPELVLFNDEMANQIVRFVESNQSAKTWFIHCMMGKCRSGAIGDVLSEYFEIPYEYFKRDNPIVQPNILVKNLLRKQFFNYGQI